MRLYGTLDEHINRGTKMIAHDEFIPLGFWLTQAEKHEPREGVWHSKWVDGPPHIFTGNYCSYRVKGTYEYSGDMISLFGGGGQVFSKTQALDDMWYETTEERVKEMFNRCHK